MGIILMKIFNSILFHMSGPANKQLTYQSIRLGVSLCLVAVDTTTEVQNNIIGIEIRYKFTRPEGSVI